LENKPFGKVERVADFLPSADKLVPRDASIKVTLSLSRESVEFLNKSPRKMLSPILG
jgi:hypothetical protein